MFIQYACRCAVAIILVVAAGAPAFAQSSDRWEVAVSPYLMAASMRGTTTLRGREVEVDVSAGDIFSNLEFGAMGMFVARKGAWGLGGDLIWVALGTTVREIDVDFNQGGFSFYGLRRLAPSTDLTFGLRINTLQGKLNFRRLDSIVEQDKTWVDPLVGLAYHTANTGRFGFRFYGEFGGFGVGSDYGWELFPALVIKLTEKTSTDLGYRWLDMKYKSGEGDQTFEWDMLTQGPVMGLTWRF